KRALPSSYPFLADAGSCPGNCSGMEEATGAPSSFAVWHPKRLRASGRDEGRNMTRPSSPLSMLLSRHTKRHAFIAALGGAVAGAMSIRPSMVSFPDFTAAHGAVAYPKLLRSHWRR